MQMVEDKFVVGLILRAVNGGYFGSVRDILVGRIMGRIIVNAS
jgi:hypothetical protein